MNKPITTAAIICCFLAITFLGSAQQLPNTPHFVYRTWNNQKGLPQNTVFDLVEDSTGYIWGSTEDGLFRFDGSRFGVINETNSPELKSNSFYDLKLQAGKLWAATRNSIVKVGYGVEKIFDLSDSLKGGLIKSIEGDQQGRIFIGTSNGHLYQISNDSIQKIPLATGTRYSSIDELLYTPSALIIGTQDGLFRLHAGSNRIEEDEYFSKTPITALEADQQGFVWVGTGSKGVVQLNSAFKPFLHLQDELKEKLINSLCIDQKNRLWIGFSVSGYMVYENGKLYHPAQDQVKQDGIRTILATKDNGIWLGTTSSGLVQVRSAIIQQIDDSLKFVGPIALAIYQTAEGDIWVGSAGKGVNRIKDGKLTVYDQSKAVSGNLILSLTDRGNFVYIGSNAGLDRFNKTTNRIDHHYTHPSLKGVSITGLLKDSQNRIWIINRRGEILLLHENDRIQKIELGESMRHLSLIGFSEGKDGTIYIGTRGAGYLRIRSTLEVQTITSSSAFPADVVYAFFEDKEGDLWISSEKGLVLEKDGEYFVFGRESGLHFNETYRILQDSQEYIWLSGNLGLQRISWSELKRAKLMRGKPVRLAVRLFNDFDGMPNAEANGGFHPAGWVMQNGNLWFPTLAGAAIVNPAIITREDKELNIQIQALQYADKLFFPGQKVKLPPGVHNFQIRYSSINFINAEDVSYSYRLRGYNNKWIEVGNRQIAYYTSLPPGDYVFEVRSTLFGEESHIASFPFSILPHFYQATWFKVLIAVLLLASLLLLNIYFRRKAQRKLREQQLILKAQIQGQEKERQIISAELHDSINQQLSTAKIYLDFARVNQDDRDELIGRSADVVTRAIQEIRSLCYSLTPVGLKDMGLKEALENLCYSYNRVGKIQIDLIYNLQGFALTEDLQFVLYRIIQEQMNNIVKHAEADSVIIELCLENGNIQIFISDNGKGFELSTVKEGLGFANMRNRVSVYKGIIEVDTAPGQGCRVVVKIPRVENYL